MQDEEKAKVVILMARCRIRVMEISGKPNRYLVVEDCGNTLHALSGIAGQGRTDAYKIARRLREERKGK